MKLTTATLDAIDSILEEVDYGEVSPLKGYVALKEVEKYVSSMLKRLSDKAMDDFSSRDMDAVSMDGYRVTSEPRGVRWDYSGCCDPVRDQMKAALASREKWLQGLEAPVVLETGETIRPAEQKFTVTLVVSPVKMVNGDAESVD